jgi:hypothetical protein
VAGAILSQITVAPFSGRKRNAERGLDVDQSIESKHL